MSTRGFLVLGVSVVVAFAPVAMGDIIGDPHLSNLRWGVAPVAGITTKRPAHRTRVADRNSVLAEHEG